MLSGNRNFEGRINPVVRSNYLASPPLVVAYAIAGTMDIDLADRRRSAKTATASRSICATSGRARRRSAAIRSAAIDSEMFRTEYGQVFEGDDLWRSLAVPEGNLFRWEEESHLR